MCTIVLLRGIVPEIPLVVAANRDEFYRRAAAGPAVLSSAPTVVAGRDLESGGSWLGVCASGLFVGVTNQRTFAAPVPGRRSRGELVIGALRQATFHGARRYVQSLDPARYNPFNLIYGDAERVEVAYGRPDRHRPAIEPVGSGVVVLCNDRIGSPDFPKAERAAELARGIHGTSWREWVVALRTLLADHQRPAAADLAPPPPDSVLSAALLRELQAICIHTLVYGTRSATLLALEPGQVTHYEYADGPPCSAVFVDQTPLLRP